MMVAVVHFPVINGGRPTLPVPSPAAISLHLSSFITRPHCGAGTTLRVTIYLHLQLIHMHDVHVAQHSYLC
jgi:hypothetical protein